MNLGNKVKVTLSCHVLDIATISPIYACSYMMISLLLDTNCIFLPFDIDSIARQVSCDTKTRPREELQHLLHDVSWC